VDRMEERGFVERTRVPEDRRIVLVRVTDAGTRMLQANDAISDELMRQVLGRLDPSELPIIARATAEVRSALEADPATQAATTLPARNLHETPTPEPRSR
jgi:DNA-binding MarR family transcriptional regulator